MDPRAMTVVGSYCLHALCGILSTNTHFFVFLRAGGLSRATKRPSSLQDTGLIKVPICYVSLSSVRERSTCKVSALRATVIWVACKQQHSAVSSMPAQGLSSSPTRERSTQKVSVLHDAVTWADSKRKHTLMFPGCLLRVRVRRKRGSGLHRRCPFFMPP